MLWDLQSRLYIIKDDIPIDENKFSIFLDYLEMYYKLFSFYSGSEQKNSDGIANEKDESQISFVDMDEDQETIYIKQFRNNYCFLVNMNENFRENKIYLNFNLEKLA